MGGVPLSHLSDRDLDEPVALGTVFEDDVLLADAVSPELGDEVDPEIIVDAATDETGVFIKFSVSSGVEFVIGGKMGKDGEREGNLHADARDNIGSVPEAHIAGVHAASRRVPGHDEEVDVDERVENNDNIPGAELGTRQAEAAAAVTDDKEPQTQQHVEDRRRIDVQVIDEVERVTRGWRQDHEHRERVLQRIRAQRSAERPR